MSSQKDLVTREIKRTIGIQRIRGRVLSNPTRRNFDVTGIASPTWCVDVDIGADVVLRDVPVKIGGHHARSFARLGSPVFLERDAQGRYQVVSAADRTNAQGNLRVLNEDTGVMTDGGSAGFTFARMPFTFYKGITPESFYDPAADASVLVWIRGYDRRFGKPHNVFPATDADGAAVFRVEDKGPLLNYAVQNTASLQPLYSRFSAVGGNTNLRSALDADGTNDGLTFRAQITETTPGVISMFAVVNKDAVGTGEDVILQTQRWRLYSRNTTTDTWAFNQGGGVVSSGSTIGTSFVLVELVASAFNNIDLYQNGTLLLHSTPGGAGMANAVSSLLYDNAIRAHNGRLVELLVLDEAVTPTKRQAIEAYFNQTMFIPFSRWHSGSHGFPKVQVLDADGVEVPLT